MLAKSVAISTKVAVRDALHIRTASPGYVEGALYDWTREYRATGNACTIADDSSGRA